MPLEKLFMFAAIAAAFVTAVVCVPFLLATDAGRHASLVLAGWGIAVPLIGCAAGFAMWRSGWFTPAPDAPAATRTVDSTAVIVRPPSPVRLAHLRRMAGEDDTDIYADPYHIDFRAEKQTARREAARIAAARAYYLALEADPQYTPSYEDDDGWDDKDVGEWGE